MGKRIELPPPRRPEGYGAGELAALLGKHPNTLRRYEDWGFVGPVPRRPNGYRYYPRRRALEAALAAIAQRGRFHDWPGARRLKALVLAAAAGDRGSARDALASYAALLGQARERLDRAEALLAGRGAAGLAGVETGARRDAAEPGDGRVGRWRAAASAGIAPDTLRDWERNGLVRPPRLPNGRRAYGRAELERVLLVKLLRDAGHSYMGMRRLLGPGAREEDLGFARDRWEHTLAGLLEDLGQMGEILDELGADPATGDDAAFKPR